MKKLLCVIAFVLGLPVIIFAQDAVKSEQKVGNLTVEVIGFKNNQGQVKVVLADSEKNFVMKTKKAEEQSGQTKPVLALTAPITDKKATVVFENLPFGVYAVRLFHDENGNGKMDRNFLGIPKEAYAFSNNVRVKIGKPPKFEDAKFELKTERMTITITIP